MNQYYNDMIYSNPHLEHHGIQGQKWGVDNGPPYPLGRDVSNTLSRGEYKQLKDALKSDYYKNMGAAQKKYDRDTKGERDARKERDRNINLSAASAVAVSKAVTNNEITRAAAEGAIQGAQQQALDRSREQFYENTQTQRDELNATQGALTQIYKEDKAALREEYKAGKEVAREEKKQWISDHSTQILIAAGITVAAATTAYVVIKNKDSIKETATKGKAAIDKANVKMANKVIDHNHKLYDAERKAIDKWSEAYGKNKSNPSKENNDTSDSLHKSRETAGRKAYNFSNSRLYVNAFNYKQKKNIEEGKKVFGESYKSSTDFKKYTGARIKKDGSLNKKGKQILEDEYYKY